MQVIHLTIAKTATGYYVEHEADKTVNAYAVTGESWEALNPALQGIETLFTIEKAADAGEMAEKLAALEAEKAALEAEKTALAEQLAALQAQEKGQAEAPELDSGGKKKSGTAEKG